LALISIKREIAENIGWVKNTPLPSNENMNRLILFISILLMLVGCGPSQKEREEIAILTCNIMGESRNMDASLRIKEINAARKEIGEDRYLDTDENIKK